MKKILTSFVALTCIVMSLSAQSVIYVSPDGTGDGSAWDKALGTIQAGIDAANALDPKAEVWVKAGTYNVTVSVFMREGVNVYGGFAGTEADKSSRAMGASGKSWDYANETIVDGGGAVRPMESRGSFTNTTILDGVTLTNGNGVSTSTSGTGGGVIIRPGFRVEHCIIKKNKTNAGGGGGVSMTGGELVGCYVFGNTQTTNANGGGGIHVNTLNGYTASINYCTVENNSSDVRGGGLNIQGAGFTNVVGIEVFNNVAEGKQGGAIFQNSVNNLMINSLIYNNTGTNAIQLRGSVLNSTIVNNVGGVYLNEGTAEIEFSNNIVWGCVVSVGGSATSLSGVANAKATVENNATYNPIPVDKNWKVNNNVQFPSNNTNGDVEDHPDGTLASGPQFMKVTQFKGNANADEEIEQFADVDWRLLKTSPCVDAGKTLAPVTIDIRNIARPQGAGYDLGAYEYVSADDPTGIARNEFKYAVYSKNQQIVISGFENPVQVSIYTISGQTIYRQSVSGYNVNIPVGKGLYIVRVNDAARKVVVE